MQRIYEHLHGRRLSFDSSTRLDILRKSVSLPLFDTYFFDTYHMTLGLFFLGIGPWHIIRMKAWLNTFPHRMYHSGEVLGHDLEPFLPDILCNRLTNLQPSHPRTCHRGIACNLLPHPFPPCH